MVGSALLVAATVTLKGPDAGAVYTPLGEIVPAEADHVTPGLPVPTTFAVNVCEAPAAIDKVEGLIRIETAADARGAASWAIKMAIALYRRHANAFGVFG